MIKDEILFVTGAGCSIPYKMPGTSELSKWIKENSVQKLSAGVQAFDMEHVQYKLNNFRNAFQSSYCESIDQFLHHRHEWAEIGKKALAACLHHYTTNYDSQYGDGDWLKYLAGRMADDCRSGQEGHNDFVKNKVAFVTFNYDLLIEQFFKLVIKNRFNQQDNPDIPFQIHHVYGHLSPKLYEVERKWKTTAKIIEDSANLIKVIGEEERKAEDLNRDIYYLFANAKQIIVMGFGWDPTNVSMLPWDACEHKPDVIMGTYGVAPPVADRAEETLTSFKTLGTITREPDAKALEIIRDKVDLQAIKRPKPKQKRRGGHVTQLEI